MNRNHCLIVFWLLIIIGWGAEGQPASECHWSPELLSLLGIDADPPTATNDRLQIFDAVVIDVEKVNAAGLFGSRIGDRVKLICKGRDTWRIKNYRNGIDATITVAPQSN